MSLLRWVLVLVPAVLLAGIASGALSGSAAGDPWYESLAKPAFQPPGWAFGVVWPILYALMGLAMAIVAASRGSRLRKAAAILFVVQLAVNLAWSPIVFAAHQVTLAFWWLLLTLVLAAATAWLFWRVRRSAGLLMLPYLAWLLFAAAVAFEVDRLNPEGETLVPQRGSTQINL